MTQLSDMQKRYVWIMGSYPKYIAKQGKGYRDRVLKYVLDTDTSVLYLFGYSNPLYFLEGRTLVRKLENESAYVLTETGEAEFRKLVLCQAGLKINPTIKAVEFKR